jgi:hypothetical protein
VLLSAERVAPLVYTTPVVRRSLANGLTARSPFGPFWVGIASDAIVGRGRDDAETVVGLRLLSVAACRYFGRRDALLTVKRTRYSSSHS